MKVKNIDKIRGRISKRKTKSYLYTFISIFSLFFFMFFISLIVNANIAFASPPSISIVSPSYNITSNQDIKIIAIISSNSTLENCTYKIDLNETNFNCSSDYFVFNKTVTLGEGTHTLEICAYDNANTSLCKSKSFEIDITPPTILMISPENGTIIKSKNVKLEVVTNEKSTCYAKRNSNEIKLSSLDKLLHSTILTSLQEGQYTYSIRCEDLAHNTKQSSTTFIVNLPPITSLNIEGNVPFEDGTYLFKQGTYKLVITSNEPLSEANLYYIFNDEVAKHTISLVPSNNNKWWEGYFVVGPSQNLKAGIFTYTIKDYDGNIAEITSNNFIIDTQAPEAPDGINYNYNNETLTITCHHPHPEDVAHYRVYKKDSKDVDYSNFITEVDNCTYTEEIEEGKTYYYRISAVDKAGNEGPLSKEIKVFIPKKQIIEKFDPVTEEKINETKRQANVLLLDIENAITELEAKQGDEKEIINTLGILATLRGIKNKLNNVKSRIEDLSPSMDSKDIDEVLSSINNQLDAYKKATPISIEIFSKKTWTQNNNEGTSNLLFQKYYEKYGKGNENYGLYLQNIKALMDSISIEATAFKVRLIYESGDEKVFVVIRKHISYNDINNIKQIIEYIPKSIASNVNKITFEIQPRVIEEDPIVMWDISKLGEREITYYVETDNLEEFQNSFTLLVPVVEQQQVSELTGFAVAPLSISNIKEFLLSNLIIIVLAISVLGIGAYYIYLKNTYEEDLTYNNLQGYEARPIKSSAVNINENAPLPTRDTNFKIRLYNELLRQYNTLKRSPLIQHKQRAISLSRELQRLYTEIQIEKLIEEGKQALRHGDIVYLDTILPTLRSLFKACKHAGSKPEYNAWVEQHIASFSEFISNHDPFTNKVHLFEKITKI